MVKRSVRIYIEGGSTGRTADQDFRRGWKKFLMELHEFARRHGFDTLEVVRGKGRQNTFERFKNHRREYPDDLCVLLVDSEIEVPEGQGPWDTVCRRDGDQWVKPDWATEQHIYLMVQFVEAWILTDQDALKRYFGEGFNSKFLPTTNLNGRSKDDINKALERATERSRKGSYRHGQAHEVMEYVRSEKVKTLPDGRRLFEELPALIEQNGT